MRIRIVVVVALALAVAACGGSVATSAQQPVSQGQPSAAFYGCQAVDFNGNGVDVYGSGQSAAACNSALESLGYPASDIADGTPGTDGQPKPDFGAIACSGSTGSLASRDDVIILVTEVDFGLCNALPGAGFTTHTGSG